MFEDSLLESEGRLRNKRGAATAASLALQCLLLGALVLLPLIYTEALPRAQMTAFLIAPGPPPAAPPPAPRELRRTVRSAITELVDGRVLLPSRIPRGVQRVADSTLDDGPPSPFAVPGSTGPGADRAGVPFAVLPPNAAELPRIAQPQRIVVSGGVTLGHLVRRVEPEYPEMAKRARIQGDVQLRAVIGRDGTIQNLSLVSGHPMLARAAIEAVRQWRYQPFRLSGQPVEVDTEIVVQFRFRN